MTKRKRNKNPRRSLADTQGAIVGNEQTTATSPVVTKLEVQKESTFECNSCNKSQQAGLLQRIEVLQAWFNALLVIAAFLAVLVATYQLSAMRNQSELMKQQLDQMGMDYRPWLSIEFGEIQEVAELKSVPIRFSLINKGRSPAFVVDSALHVSLLENVTPGDEVVISDIESRLRSTKQIYEKDHQQLVIPPEMHYRFDNVSSDTLSEQQYSDIDNSTSMLLAICRVKYKDTAGKEHATQGCFWYDAERKLLRAYDKYNRMD